jgi:hypothetical protein
MSFQIICRHESKGSNTTMARSELAAHNTCKDKRGFRKLPER